MAATEYEARTWGASDGHVSKPTLVGGRARKRRRTIAGEAMDADQLQRALISNRIVKCSSSSSEGQAAYRVTTTTKDVWDHVKGGNGNVVESWNTMKMKKWFHLRFHYHGVYV